jgi:hypothetical protein
VRSRVRPGERQSRSALPRADLAGPHLVRTELEEAAAGLPRQLYWRSCGQI